MVSRAYWRIRCSVSDGSPKEYEPLDKLSQIFTAPLKLMKKECSTLRESNAPDAVCAVSESIWKSVLTDLINWGSEILKNGNSGCTNAVLTGKRWKVRMGPCPWLHRSRLGRLPSRTDEFVRLTHIWWSIQEAAERKYFCNSLNNWAVKKNALKINMRTFFWLRFKQSTILH